MYKSEYFAIPSNMIISIYLLEIVYNYNNSSNKPPIIITIKPVLTVRFIRQ